MTKVLNFLGGPIFLRPRSYIFRRFYIFMIKVPYVVGGPIFFMTKVL